MTDFTKIMSHPTQGAYVSAELDRIADVVKYKFSEPGQDARVYQALVLGEEAGEALQAVRRYVGAARQTVSRTEVAMELADVVVSAQVLARLMDIHLDEAVRTKLGGISERGGL